MPFDVPTLVAVAIVVAATVGVVLLFVWSRDRATPALMWWGCAYLVGAAGLALIVARGFIPNWLSIDVANALVIVGFTFLVVGGRSFGGRPTPTIVFFIGPLIWLAALRFPLFADINARAILVSSIQAALVLMLAGELWRGRSEVLMWRWPAIVVLVAHAGALLLRIPGVLLVPIAGDTEALRGAPFGVVAFGTVAFTIALALFLLAMVRERAELTHKTAALVDTLTGLANRRAFLDQGERHMSRHRRSGMPIAVLLADLDNFKAVNDEFGHAAGDRVLQVFADAIGRNIRPGDLAGRLGGEEFAVVLPGSEFDAAIGVAERIRRTFADLARDIGGEPVAATASIGVTATRTPATQLTELLGVADRALYRAKADGRDRVAAIDLDRRPQPEAPSIVPAQLAREAAFAGLNLVRVRAQSQ